MPQTNKPTASYDRTAGHSIRGYKYQFDKTIIELIEADNCAQITVEGIEDYDIASSDATESVQVKYLAAQSFSLAVIRSAVIPMLADSVSNLERRYRLYIYCGDLSNFASKVDLQSLKECLTIRHTGKQPTKLFEAYTPDQLESFSIRLTLEQGKLYEDQKKEALGILMKEFKCSEEDCRDLFLPAARDAVSEIAIKFELFERSLSKKEFIRIINRRHLMYTRWHAKHVGEDRFVAAIRKRVKAVKAASSIKQRLLIVSYNDLGFDGILELTTRLSRSYTNRSLTNARPWTVVVDANTPETTRLKAELLRAGVKINDGWEHLSFTPEHFNDDPIINRKNRTNIIERSSYSLRIISLGTYVAHQSKITKPDHVFSASDETIPGFEDKTFFLVRLPTERIYEVTEVS
jgi:hypothetical protein